MMTTQPRRRPAAGVLLAAGDGAAATAGLELVTWLRYTFKQARISLCCLLAMSPMSWWGLSKGEVGHLLREACW